MFFSGAPIHKAYSLAQIQQDISWSAGVALVFMLILSLLVFHALRPFFLILSTVFIGTMCGFLITHLWMGNVHIVTLVFGTAVICVSINYTFQYLCDSFHPHWTSQTGLEHIFPALKLGVITSVIAYLCLFLAPYPGLKGIALFSAAGLFSSWLAIVMILPLGLKGFHIKDPNEPSRIVRLLISPISPYKKGSINEKTFFWTTIVIIMICVPGILQLSPSDHLRILNSQYIIEDQNTSTPNSKEPLTARMENKTAFYLIMGNTADDVLLQEERLRHKLNPLIDLGSIDGYRAISEVIPSRLSQQKNFERLKLITQGKNYSNITQNFNVPIQALGKIRQAFTVQYKTLTIDNVEAMLPPLYKNLWLGCKPTQCTTVLTIENPQDKTLMSLFAGQLQNVYWLDRESLITDTLTEYRQFMILLLCTALILITLIISVFTQLSHAMHITLIPTLAMMISLAIIGYCEMVYCIYNLLALLIILGFSLDYTIFYRLADEDGVESTVLAMTLSAITTVIAFLLFIFSSNPVIQAFGLTLTAGLISAYALTLLFGRQGLIKKYEECLKV